MNLIDRYLGSVAWQLPSAMRDDIVSELRDDILSRIEDVEAAGGQPATDAQIAAVLRATGHPATVAARYAGQGGLLPPEAVPWWWAHVRALAALIAVLYAAGALLALFAGRPVMQAIMQSVAQGLGTFLQWLGALTLVYLGFVRHLYPKVLAKWDPARLPPAEPPAGQRQSPVAHAVGLVFSVAFLLWWMGLVQIPAVPEGLVPGKAWSTLYWPVVVLLLLGIVRALMEMFLPARRQAAAAVALLISVGSIAAGAFLLRNGPIVALADTTPSYTAMRLASGINAVGPIALVCIVIAHLFEGWGAARRLFRPDGAGR